MNNPRYWRHRAGCGWLGCTNQHELEMGHCLEIYCWKEGGRLCGGNLAKADQYTLRDIHELAAKECIGAVEGRFRGYVWTRMLGQYASEPQFYAEVVDLGSLPEVLDPRVPMSMRQTLYDKRTRYEDLLERARVELLRKDLEGREGAPVGRSDMERDNYTKRSGQALSLRGGEG